MKLAKCLLLAGSVVAMVSNSPRAKAQGLEVTDTRDGYEIEFSDDDLLGEMLDLQGHVVRLRPGATRVLLIRPRSSFVPEMSQSVEDL